MQERLLIFIKTSNWILMLLLTAGGFILSPFKMGLGIFAGGLIVTINFHLLYHTLKKALTPSNLTSHNAVIAKYYLRFLISGVIIYLLITRLWVNPLGLVIGLSVVVASIFLATINELNNLFKEAV